MGIQITASVEVNTNQVIDDITDGLVLGLNKAAHRLLGLSAVEVPHHDGTLEGSGQVLPAEDPTQGAAVTYDTPYAARLHEHPEYNFQNGRKGKYLEDPALRDKDELGDIIAAEVRRG